MSTKTATKTWRSGWCGHGNGPMSHALCAGAVGHLVCVCACHEPAPPPKPDLLAALARAVAAVRSAAQAPTPRARMADAQHQPERKERR